MGLFEVSDCFYVEVGTHYNYLCLGTGFVRKFWAQNGADAYRKKRGCYIFGIRHGSTTVPTYIGKATKSFSQEIFQRHKKKH